MKGDRDRRSQHAQLGGLADDVVAVQRPIADSAARLRQARNRLLVSARAPSPRPFLGGLPVRGWRWAAIVSTATAALALAFIVFRTTAPLTFHTGSPGVVARVGTPLRASGDAPLPVRFSDGSTFTAAPRSEVTVTDVGPAGARVVLDDGAVAAAVVHRANSRWHVQAGPYTVQVTGTRFTVHWDRRARSFSLTLDEGGVTVFGPAFGAAGRRVSPHETVRVAPEAPPAAPPPSASTTGVSAPSLPPPAAEPAHPAKRPRGLASLEPAGRPGWKDLAQAERYGEALAAAETAGFATLCRRASAAELLLLGNAARFAQNPGRAEQAFRAIRARQDGRHERAVAAFELGRLAHDVSRRYREAADWFGVYLREEPSGALAREAAGRQLEALHRAGDVGAARRAAESFRGRYPDGPYHDLAQQVLGM